MNNSNRRGTWIVTLCLAAIAIVYLKFIWLPGYRAIQELGKQVEAKQAFVAQSAGLSAALTGTQHELEKSKSLVDEWEKTAPGKRDVPALYAKIDVLAKNAHLAIVGFDPQPSVVHEKLREISINMSCLGNFSQIYEFLQAIEGLSATVWVESMRLEKSSQNTKDVQCELNLVVFSNNS